MCTLIQPPVCWCTCCFFAEVQLHENTIKSIIIILSPDISPLAINISSSVVKAIGLSQSQRKKNAFTLNELTS